jgi:cysteine desulfuration protein SufE
MLGKSSSTLPSILIVSSFDIEFLAWKCLQSNHILAIIVNDKVNKVYSELKNSREEMIFSLEEKIEFLKKKFTSLSSPDQKYSALIEMGRELDSFKEKNKTDKNLVSGCQSKLWLYSYKRENKIFFEATSDALISKGLAALLIEIYNGESPDLILTHSPLFLHELGIYASLSPHRSNGLSNIHLKMKQDALTLYHSRVS